MTKYLTARKITLSTKPSILYYCFWLTLLYRWPLYINHATNILKTAKNMPAFVNYKLI